MTSARKPILCVDFDGVLHSYTSGWQGASVVADGPVPGAIEWLSRAVQHFEVAIYSSRSKDEGGLHAMQYAIAKWCAEELGPGEHIYALIAVLSWPTQKPAAFLTIDDRAICFNGSWNEVHPETLLAFKPWNKRP